MGYSDGIWIYYHTGDKKRPDSRQGNPSPYFRKCFSLRNDVEKAVMYISCLGIYKAYINGKQISDDYFAPGRCDYGKRIPLVEYDITELVCEDNAVGIVCGDGWAVGLLPFGNSFRRGCFSDEIYLYAVIDITYKNGETETITTDRTWKAGTGSVVYSSLYDGECIDARKACDGFSEILFDDSGWKNVSEDIFSRNHLLLKFEGPDIVMSGSVKSVKSSESIYDFGKPLSGGLKLKVSGKSGCEVKVKYSDDAEFASYTEDLFILRGDDEEEFLPLFSIHRFRYANIVTECTVIDVEAVEVGSDVQRTGDFYCSDNRLNEAFVNAVRLQKRRFLSVPESEFYGETSDDTAIFDMYSFDVNRFYEKYFGDIRDSQFANGFVSSAIPIPQFGYRRLPGESSSAEAIKLVYSHYVMFGNADVVKKNMPMCKQAAMYLKNETPLVLCEVYSRLVNLCLVVSDADASEYKQLYNESKLSFLTSLNNGHTENDSQGDYITAYESGVLSANEVRQPLLNTVKRDDEPHPHLLHVLCDIGERDLAYSLVFEKKELLFKTGDFSWLFSGMLGIKPVDTVDGAGFKKVVIEPAIDLTDSIRKAGGSCVTPNGKISVYWEKTDDVYTCCLTVPFDIDATCRFPGFKVVNQRCSRETYVFTLRKVVK